MMQSISKQASKGFTLIEVLITMVIVSVGLLAMAQMLITTMQQNAKSEQRMDASSVTQALLNEATTKISSLSGVVSGMGCGTGTNVISSTAIAGQGAAAPQVRYYNGKIYSDSVVCKDVVGQPGSYILVATVTDTMTNQVTTNQMLYTTVSGGTAAGSAAAGSGSVGTALPVTNNNNPPASNNNNPPASNNNNPPASNNNNPPASNNNNPPANNNNNPPANNNNNPPAGTTITTTMGKESATVNVAVGSTTVQVFDDKGKRKEKIVLDSTQLADMLSNSSFKSGLANKADYTKLTSCNKGGLNSPSLTVAGITAAFTTVASNSSTNWGDLESALADFSSALKDWGKVDNKNAGQNMDSALKNLAKAAGC